MIRNKEQMPNLKALCSVVPVGKDENMEELLSYCGYYPESSNLNYASTQNLDGTFIHFIRIPSKTNEGNKLDLDQRDFIKAFLESINSNGQICIGEEGETLVTDEERQSMIENGLAIEVCLRSRREMFSKDINRNALRKGAAQSDILCIEADFDESKKELYFATHAKKKSASI